MNWPRPGQVTDSDGPCRRAANCPVGSQYGPIACCHVGPVAGRRPDRFGAQRVVGGEPGSESAVPVLLLKPALATLRPAGSSSGPGRPGTAQLESLLP